MDGERLTLAVIKKKVVKVYLHHDGKQWKDGKEEDHKKKLEELKKKCKPGETLDISKREDTDVGIYHCTPYGSGEIDHSFNLKSVTVTKVVDGEYTVWRAPKGSSLKCTHAQIRVGDGKETLRLEVKMDKEGEIEFNKESGQWKGISETTDDSYSGESTNKN